MQLFRGLIISLIKSDFVQYFKSDVRFQIVYSIVNGFQFVIRRHHTFIGIDFLVLSPKIGSVALAEEATPTIN